MKYSGGIEVGHLVEWPGFLRVQEVAANTLQEEGIALVHGRAGVGKTVAIRHFARTLAGAGERRVIHFEIPQACTVRQLTRLLLKQLTGVFEDGDTLKLQDKIVGEMERPTVAIFDEADRARRNGFELIRDLHDCESTRLTAFLVGSPEAYRVLRHHPLLFDRVESRCEVPVLEEQEVKALLPVFHDLYRDAEEEAVRILIQTTGRVFRRIAVFTRKAEKLIASVGAPRLTKEIAMAVNMRMDLNEP